MLTVVALLMALCFYGKCTKCAQQLLKVLLNFDFRANTVHKSESLSLPKFWRCFSNSYPNVTSKITMCANLTKNVSIEYTKIKIFRRENPFGFLAKLMEKLFIDLAGCFAWWTLLRRLKRWVSGRKRFVSIIICVETSLWFLFAYRVYFIEMNLIVLHRPHLVNDYGDSCYEC